MKLVGEVESIPPGVTQTDKVDADMIQTTAPPGKAFFIFLDIFIYGVIFTLFFVLACILQVYEAK